MAKKRMERIERLLQAGQWSEARDLLEQERVSDSENHWLLTQIGVTLYEERRYEDALRLFKASSKIVPECPLTLWNVAGTLDAIKRPRNAMAIYTWLRRAENSSVDDPCWESKIGPTLSRPIAFIDTGVCFQRLGENEKAEHCYRQYINLLLSGIDGSCAVEEVKQRIQQLHAGGEKHTRPTPIAQSCCVYVAAPSSQGQQGSANRSGDRGKRCPGPLCRRGRFVNQISRTSREGRVGSWARDYHRAICLHKLLGSLVHTLRLSTRR